MIARFLIAYAAALLPIAALAQQPEPRTLEVPATASWKHAITEMILPPRAAGFERGAIRDNGAGEFDVHAQYESAQDGTTATFYLYRTQVPDVGLWFDRAVATVVRTPVWGVNAADLAAGTPFARPGSTQESGLISAMKANGRGYVSTGVAIAPLGDWLVKVRMSSSTLDPAALDARMRAFLDDLPWPAAPAGEQPARLVEPCAKPLKLKRAKVVRPNMTDVLLGLVGGIAAQEKEDAAPVYCREPADLGPHAVYRPDGSSASYLIAFNDAGLGLSVEPALTIEGLSGGGGGRSWSMTLLDRNSRSALLSFNRLPPPEQALAVAFGGGPTVSVTTK